MRVRAFVHAYMFTLGCTRAHARACVCFCVCVYLCVSVSKADLKISDMCLKNNNFFSSNSVSPVVTKDSVCD